MRRAVACGVMLIAAVDGSSAQDWRPGPAVALIRRAAAHRAARDADTLVTAWQAVAHGILRYASVLDHGDGPVERVIRADELRLEVYGESPNRSKQIIVAWRDTSFLPNRMVYHRDHLGIVANDFGTTIRLGQGEEVRDVVHPLSDAGLSRYMFALGDTVVLSGPAGRVRVVAVQVRPIDPDSAGAVGTLYLDVDRAALVRFRFTFTPASYRDRSVEAITVTLENALQQQARWLPWRQSLVIRRELPLLDLALRTVIRADWTIDDYQLGVHHPPDRFVGPFIVGPGAAFRGGAWDAPLALGLDALPGTDRDVAEIEQAASESLAGHLLDGLPRVRLRAAGISDFIRVNRVEGVTPAIGMRLAISGAMVARGRIGVGLSDQRLVGRVSLDRAIGATTWSVSAERTVRDIGDMPVISGVANSLGTAISGADFGDYTLRQSIGLGYATAEAGWRLTSFVGYESSAPVASAFTPISGSTAPNPVLGSRDGLIMQVGGALRDAHGYGWSFESEHGTSWHRVFVSAVGHIAMPSGELLPHADAGIGWGDLPDDRSFVLGGRGTLLGVPFRSLGGRRIARAEVAWAIPVALPTPPLPYSRLIRLPSVLSPFVAAGIAGGDMPGVPWRATGRIESSAGLRLDLWGPLIRVEAAVALRTGQVGVAVDVHPDWWGVM